MENTLVCGVVKLPLFLPKLNMTNESSKAQAMTTQEVNEFLAEKIMGWERVILDYHELEPKDGYVIGKDGETYMTPSNAKWEEELSGDSAEWIDNSVGEYWIDLRSKNFIDESEGEFNPCTNANHLETVIKEVNKNLPLRNAMMVGMIGSAEYADDGWYIAMFATTEQKARAIVASHLSLQS